MLRAMKKGLNVQSLMMMLIALLLSAGTFAQTPGVIFDPATGYGKTVLDRNGDGYTSASNSGFTTNDVTQSEMSFTAIPQLSAEPNGDILRGPTCGFPDFTDNGSNDAVGVRLDSATYLMYRFRMSNAAPNSKGYSVLVDADGKFGSTGPYADPNYTTGNPGFEFEIILETNFRVAIYNVDGTTTPTLVKAYTGHTNYQKSVAFNTNCTQAYFLDFFVKVSDLPSPYNNISTTTFRYAVNTVMSPHSAMQGPISDVGGVSDAAYSNNLESEWIALMNNQQATTLSNISTALNAITMYPTVSSPIYNGATTVYVTNNDASTASLTVYKIHSGITSTLGVISSVASGSLGSLSVSALSTGDQIYATATATSKQTSLNSATVTVVSGSAPTCTAKSTAPVITCISTRGMQGTTVYSGATINIYSNNGTFITSVTAGTTLSGGVYTWAYDPKTGNSTSPCTTGTKNALQFGSLLVSVAAGGTRCESNLVASGSASGTCSTVAPTVSTINYSTGVISGTSSGASDSIGIFRNGARLGSVIATGSAWTYTGTFYSTDTLSVAAYTSGSCMSAMTLAIKAPIVSSPIYAGATSVKGTSVAPSGSTITVYKIPSGSSTASSVGTTTVDAYGNWNKTGLTALASGDQIYAVVTQAGYSSSNSNTVTVSAAQSSITPTITGSYTETGTNVGGTLPSAQTGTVKVYEDGTLIGSVSVTSATTWTVTGISSTPLVSGSPVDNYLYAGGVLNATFTPSTGGSEGSYSNSVTVGCIMPQTTQTLSFVQSAICYNTTGQVKVLNSESGIIYTLVDNSTHTTKYSTSMVGTGGTITFTTFNMTANTIVTAAALKVSPVSCSNYETDTALVKVNNLPNAALTVTATSSSVCNGSSTSITISSSESGIQYQLRDASYNNIGSAITGTGGTISLSTGALTSTTTFNILATDVTKSTNCNTQMSTTPTITVTTVTTSNAGSTQTICGTSTALAGNTPSNGTGTWTVVSGSGSFTNANSATTTVTGLGHGTNVFKWTIANGSCSSNSSVNIVRDCPASYTTSTSGGTYSNNQNVATVTDPDGTVTAATLTSGTLPPGTALNTLTGAIYVTDWSLMRSGTWTPTILTTDQYGGQTTNSPTLSFINPLPVTLIDFTAQLQDDIVRLNWSTASELNNNYFDVERSANGTEFNSIGTVQGHNTTSVRNDYISYDESPIDGINYYRLKQVDNNGSYSYSRIVAVTLPEKLISNVSIYPNPVNNNQEIHITASMQQNSLVTVKLYNANGQEVYSNSITANKGIQNISIPAMGLKPGLYSLIMIHNTQQITQKIIVQ
jgi:hypothetical protein